MELQLGDQLFEPDEAVRLCTAGQGDAASGEAPQCAHELDAGEEPPWVSLDSLAGADIGVNADADDSVSARLAPRRQPSLEGPPAPEAEDDPESRRALESLSEIQVAQLLTSLGLGKYVEMCLRVPLRGIDLMHCRQEDLEEIGICFRPHRCSLLDQCAQFRRAGVPGQLLCGAAIAPTHELLVTGTVAPDDDTPSWIQIAEHKLSSTPQSPARGAAPGASGALAARTPRLVCSPTEQEELMREGLLSSITHRLGGLQLSG